MTTAKKATQHKKSTSPCAQRGLKISAMARYALRALLDIASNGDGGEPRSGAAIARSQQISEKFLSRIVIPLRRNGLLRSARGNNGGFLLAKNPEDITLLEIVETIQGPTAILDCLAPKSSCPRLRSCPARRVWADVNTAFKNTLSGITLAAILRKDPKAAQALDYCI